MRAKLRFSKILEFQGHYLRYAASKNNRTALIQGNKTRTFYKVSSIEFCVIMCLSK